jgi:8-oxo-dGTP pyrophosphatase MutT (NUDIX family)
MSTLPALYKTLQDYTSRFAEELAFREQFLALLTHPRAFHRDHLPGHITGSAWIVDSTTQVVLLTHHAKLDKWLQPGGHADGDPDVQQVALREAWEETGLKSLQLRTPAIFDIDIHTIPARKDFPEHLHFDVRFLLEADRHEPLVITHESNDLQWVALDRLADYTTQRSMARMREKLYA